MLTRTSPGKVTVPRIFMGCQAIAAFIVMPWHATMVHELEDLEDSIAEDTDLLEISATSIGQATLNEGDSSGSYELDIIGSYRLLKREPGQLVGDGRLSFWVFTVGKLGNDAAGMAKMQVWPGSPVTLASMKVPPILACWPGSSSFSAKSY